MLNTIDNMPVVRRAVARSAILTCCGVFGYFYYTKIYALPKLEYNKVWVQIADRKTHGQAGVCSASAVIAYQTKCFNFCKLAARLVCLLLT